MASNSPYLYACPDCGAELLSIYGLTGSKPMTEVYLHFCRVCERRIPREAVILQRRHFQDDET